jgi:hypothetical protein
MTGSGRKGANDNETKVQMRSQVDHRPVSGEMCRAELPGGNQFRRASVLITRRQGRLRHSLRSRRKGRTRFQRSPDRQRRILNQTAKRIGDKCHVYQQSNRGRKISVVIPRFAHCRQVRTWRISQSQPRRDLRIERTSSRNAPNGIESLLSGSSPTTASACFPRHARSTSTDG